MNFFGVVIVPEYQVSSVPNLIFGNCLHTCVTNKVSIFWSWMDSVCIYVMAVWSIFKKWQLSLSLQRCWLLAVPVSPLRVFVSYSSFLYSTDLVVLAIPVFSAPWVKDELWLEWRDAFQGKFALQFCGWYFLFHSSHRPAFPYWRLSSKADASEIYLFLCPWVYEQTYSSVSSIISLENKNVQFLFIQDIRVLDF